MGRGSREYYISCREEECWEILEALLESIKARNISYKVSDKGIWIRVSGLAPEAKQTWFQAKRIAASTKSLSRSRRGTQISLEAVFSRVKATFPPQVLEEVLSLSGYPTSITGGEIVTAASPDTLLAAASRIAAASRSLPPRLRGSAARKFVLAASTVLGAEPSTVVEEAVDKGILMRDPDTGFLILTREWRSALRGFIREAGGTG